MKKSLPAALLALSLLAACSGDEPEAPAAGNDVEMLDVTNDAGTVPEAPPPAEMTNLLPAENFAAEPLPPVEPDEQVRDDADATGMTSRVDRDAGDTATEDTVTETDR